MATTWADYFTLPATNWSRLKILDKSPLAFRYAEDHPAADTDQTATGRYVHAAIFGPETILRDFLVWEGRRQGKAWEVARAQHADKTILRAADAAEAEDMIAAVRTHPDVKALLADPDTRVEQIVQWSDTATGARCKSRIDIINPRLRVLADLKTTKSIDVRRFGHDIARYQYHGQLAYYSMGVEAALGWRPERHLLIAVEKSAPYDVAIFEMGGDALLVGADKCRALLTLLRDCTERDHWPGRHPKPVTLDATNLPPWIFGGGAPEIMFLEDES